MKNIGLSVKRSFLSVLALAAGIALCAGTAFAVPAASSIKVPVYGSVSDITENNVILTGDATVTTQLAVGGAASLNVSIQLNKVSGRSEMSGAALEASGSFTGSLPVGNQGTVTFPVTVYPAGSDATDPEAFTVNASVNVKLTPAGAPAGGLGQFSIVLTPAA
ncbi:MAG: hypothetical protein ACJ78V_17440 [Myxococcales bacterium]